MMPFLVRVFRIHMMYPKDMGRYFLNVYRSLRKIVFSFFGGFFGGIILGFFLVGLFFRYFDAQDQVILNLAINSPDNKYTAVSYTNMGGGAAGYCATHISIVPWDTFDKFQKTKFTVASGSCGKPEVKWDSDRILEIKDLDYVYSKEERNSDGKVKVVHSSTTVRYSN